MAFFLKNNSTVMNDLNLIKNLILMNIYGNGKASEVIAKELTNG